MQARSNRPLRPVAAALLPRSGGGGGIPGGAPSGGDEDDLGPGRQGPRVSSLTLEDGTVAELGASIFFSGNRLVSEVVDADPRLKKVTPGQKDGDNGPDSFGIYDGDGVWDLLVPNTADRILIPKLLWRYGFDIIRMRTAVMGAFATFSKIYDLLDGSTVFESPDHLWKTAGLGELTTISFDDYLDSIGIASEKPHWSWIRSLLAYLMPGFDILAKSFLPIQGNLRKEILASINLNNYNQANNQLDGRSPEGMYFEYLIVACFLKICSYPRSIITANPILHVSSLCSTNSPFFNKYSHTLVIKSFIDGCISFKTSSLSPAFFEKSLIINTLLDIF